MSNSPPPVLPVHPVDTVDGFPVAVRVSGPRMGPVVVMFADPSRDCHRYESLCERLHVARLRTVLIAPDPRLDATSVLGVLDALQVRWALLVGDRYSGELAWKLAATRQERFSGLVVIDVGHPRVADASGVVRDKGCPPVHVDTTALVSTPAARTVARASGRFVHGDFRLADRVGKPNAAEAMSQLVTEIVLRSHWL